MKVKITFYIDDERVGKKQEHLIVEGDKHLIAFTISCLSQFSGAYCICMEHLYE